MESAKPIKTETGVVKRVEGESLTDYVLRFLQRYPLQPNPNKSPDTTTTK
jgi:hypothetical protein